MVNAIQTALSGLTASTKRISASAQNIANANTSGSLQDTDNAPYTPVTTVQSAQDNDQGVTADIIPSANPFTPAYDPNSPFANTEGFVGAPNVNLAEEAVNIKMAEYSFRANLEVIETVSEMTESLFEAFDEEV